MVNHLFRFSFDSVKARPAGPVHQIDGWLFRSFFTHISFKMGTVTLAVILLDFWYTVTFHNKARVNSIIQLL